MHPAVTNGAYDVNRIRADFPILATQVYGKPLVYLDNAASAQKPQAVLDRINQAYTSILQGSTAGSAQNGTMVPGSTVIGGTTPNPASVNPTLPTYPPGP